MWPWVSTTASTDSAGTANRSQFRSRSRFSPWKSPQSNSTRLSSVSIRCRDPDTMPAAPRNVSRAIRPP